MLSHERAQHAEARRGLSLVIEGGAGHVGDEPLPAVRDPADWRRTPARTIASNVGPPPRFSRA